MFRSLNQPIRNADWRGLRVWLVGASTGIGAALSEQLAELGATLVLSARHHEALESVAALCRRRHSDTKVSVLPFDICEIQATQSAIAHVRSHLGGIDLVIFNAGTYEATRIDHLTTTGAEHALKLNLLAPINATALMLPLLMDPPEKDRPRGFAYVASVAGYRGLPRSLTYGPGKAGLINFAESLWVDLHGMGLNTWVINPGFVRTRLTAQNSFAMPALIEPEEAAAAIVRGFASGSFEIHFPKRFSYFMKLLRLLPTACYLRLTQRLVPPLTQDAVKSSHLSEKE